MYACKIKETTNGCRRSARSEARKALEVLVERSIAQDGKLNESKPVTGAREDETEKIAEEKAPLGRAWRLLHCHHRLSQRVQAYPARSCKGVIKHINQE
jgi:hypothetical protein